MQRMTDHGTPSRPIGPVHRAFGLLQLIVDAGDPVGVRELARRSGLSRSTTARLLGILGDLAMVERTEAGAARPGAGLITLTRHVDRSPTVLRERLRPLAVEIEREFGENAAVGIDDGDGFLYLASARASAAVQVADPTGLAYPYHLVAPGLAAMAQWDDDRLDDYLATPLEAATTHSDVDPDSIRRRLEEIRRLGYAWTDQELDLEVNGIAVPIDIDDAGPTAIATLYGPTYRLDPVATPELGIRLVAFVRERSAGLFAG
jgi:IclR family transcriptional regulator, acetate operon repressor